MPISKLTKKSEYGQFPKEYWHSSAALRPLFTLHILLAHPFHKLLLKFLLAGQVKLVFAGVDVRVFGKGNLDEGGILLLAEHYADGVILRLGSDVAFKIVDLHLHLTCLTFCKT